MQGAHIRVNYLEDFVIKRHGECYETCILKIWNGRLCMSEPNEMLLSWCPLQSLLPSTYTFYLCGERVYCFLPCASKETFCKFGLVPSTVISTYDELIINFDKVLINMPRDK